MEEKIKSEIIKYIKTKRAKTLDLSEIYQNLNLPYIPENDKLIYKILNEIEKEGYICPLKTMKKNFQGCFTKYKILKKEESKENIKEEILKLNKKLKIDYFLKYPEQYIKNREIILLINEFIANSKNKEMGNLTVNERSYKIFKDEKKLKANENLIKKLGLNYKDLFAYDTYEPFFYYRNKDYKENETNENKTIIIVENKDTFWSIVKAIQNLKIENIYMIVYGEGKKILKSFLFAKEIEISKDDDIKYFGDIDYEGINIYVSLKEKFNKYRISAYKLGYETILDIESMPKAIRTNQEMNLEKVNKFTDEFNEDYKAKLLKIFDNKEYIPQEVFNYETAMQKLKNSN